MNAARIIAIFSALVAAIVLGFGWIAGVDAIKGLLPGLATMKFNTAFCFLLSSVALWFISELNSEQFQGRAAQLCSLLVASIAVVTLFEYLLHANFGFAELIVSDPGTDPAKAVPGQMSAATAFNFLLLSTSLFTISFKGNRYVIIGQFAALITALGGLIGVEGYLFGYDSLYRFFPYASMALHTSILFVLLSIGVLLVRSEEGFMRTISSTDAGGVIARRLLPFTLLAPVFVAWLMLIGYERGMYDAEVGVAIFTITGIIAVSTVVWLSARYLNRMHRQLNHRNRLYELLSSCNQLIVRSTDRQQFLSGVCRVIVGVGQFELAWIAMRQDSEHFVVPVASAGDIHFPKGFSIPAEMTDANDGPVAACMYRRQPVVVTDVENEAGMSVWRDFAREHNLASFASFPLIIHDNVLGVFCLHSKEKEYFGISELQLLSEVASDISFAIAQIESETLRHQAELKASYLAAIVESSGDAIVGKDPSGIITSWNEGAKRVFEYSAEEMIGRSIKTLIPVERLAEEDMILGKIRLGHRVEHFETVRMTKSGRRIDVSVAVSPIRDQNGRIIGASKVARDVSGRKEAERRLIAMRAELELTHRVVESAPSGILIVDAAGKIRLANPEMERIFGYSKEELIGAPMDMLVPDSIRSGHPGLRAGFMKQPSVRAMGKGRDLFGQRKDGSLVPVEIGLTPIPGQEEMLVAATIVDVTARKEIEGRLAEQRDELERSNKDLEQFAYVASHDLQEPLRAVAGCVQLLRQRYEDKLDERGIEFITHAVEGANRMQALIDGLLSYSRVGSRLARKREVDANEAVDAALANLNSSIEESDAKITFDALPTVTADATQLVLLFQNLIGNAIKFRRIGIPPEIHITARMKKRLWQFSIADNGIGIDPQFSERIFGVFQRLHTRGEYPGTGIGLAICKRIVEHNGGQIWLESIPGNGTTFFFTMPLAKASDSHQRQPQDEASVASGSKN